MPIIADKVLGGDAHTLGFLTAATGLGALACAVALAIAAACGGWANGWESRRRILGVSLILLDCRDRSGGRWC